MASGDGPTAAAAEFLAAVLARGDLKAAWPIMRPSLRRSVTLAFAMALARAQAAQGVRADAQLAADLIEADGPAHELWPVFQTVVLDSFQEVCAHVDLGAWEWLPGIHLVALDRETVKLVDSRHPRRLGEHTVCNALVLLMHHDSDTGWTVEWLETAVAVVAPGAAV